MNDAATSARRVPIVVRVLLVPAVTVGLIALAILFARNVMPGSERVKIALIVALLLLVGLALGRLVKSRAELRWPMRVATIGAGVLVLAWYGESLRGEDVQEQLIDVPPAAASAPRDSGNAPSAPGPRLLARGRFAELEHQGSGTAEIVRDGDDTVLQLRDFNTDAGPDLRLYLSTGHDGSDFVDLGGLKGNSGDQQYNVPRDADLDRFDTVLVSCRAFSVGFTSAELRRERPT